MDTYSDEEMRLRLLRLLADLRNYQTALISRRDETDAKIKAGAERIAWLEEKMKEEVA